MLYNLVVLYVVHPLDVSYFEGAICEEENEADLASEIKSRYASVPFPHPDLSEALMTLRSVAGLDIDLDPIIGELNKDDTIEPQS